MNTIIPIILPTGTLDFPRFYITTSTKERKYWNDYCQKWLTAKREATVFDCIDIATIACCKLLRQQFDGKPQKKFTVPICIDLMSDEQIDEQKIQAWLRKVTQFTVAYGNYGAGPTPNSLALTYIDWSRFTEVL